MRLLQYLFAREQHPRKGLTPPEWATTAYLFLTLFFIFFTYTKLASPEGMIALRIRIAATMFLLWLTYRIHPCRLTMLARLGTQLAMLSWWYPDTYELNRILPNLDHIFAQWEQTVFGCQPALLFCDAVKSPVFSELMDLGYASYFPLIAIVTVFYFASRYEDFVRAVFVIMASFFLYYLIFIILPVTGPQYYYEAVGLDSIAKGIFPNIHDYFNHTQQRMVSPGWSDGFFYQMVEDAHNAGERPTAAFPSSHVGITTVLMLLAHHTGQRRLTALMAPFFLLMCLATVYIRAHYAIDVVAGLATGILFYTVLMALSEKIKETPDKPYKRKKQRKRPSEKTTKRT